MPTPKPPDTLRTHTHDHYKPKPRADRTLNGQGCSGSARVKGCEYPLSSFKQTLPRKRWLIWWSDRIFDGCNPSCDPGIWKTSSRFCWFCHPSFIISPMYRHIPIRIPCLPPSILRTYLPIYWCLNKTANPVILLVNPHSSYWNGAIHTYTYILSHIIPYYPILSHIYWWLRHIQTFLLMIESLWIAKSSSHLLLLWRHWVHLRGRGFMGCHWKIIDVHL